MAFAGATASADTVFDDFEDGVIDGDLWTILSPFAASSAVESGGKLNLTSRPYVATADEWLPSASDPLVIEFDWAISSSVSHLNVMSRSDAMWHGPFAEASNGVGVNFSAQADWVWLVRIVDANGADVSGAARGDVSFSIEPGTTYRVRITDDGTNLRVFIDDFTTPLVSGTVVDSFDVNRVVFYNREFASTDTLDNVRISGARVDEPPVVLLTTVAIGLFALWIRRRQGMAKPAG